MRKIRIATRGSELALAQARLVAGLLSARHPNVAVELVLVESEGDRDRATPLAALGGTGVFTRKIQEAVLSGSADLAVHSAKDLPTGQTPELVLAAVPARGPREDVLVAGRRRLADLPAGSRIGTSSPRRQAFLAALRNDLVFEPVRGNVPTRIRKRAEGEYDALVLARAGLERLGLAREIDQVFGPEMILPAVGQGALAVEAREDDRQLRDILAGTESVPARREVEAERAFLATLGGGCHLPAGIWSETSGDSLVLEGGVALPDGSRVVRRRVAGAADDAPALGHRLAEELLASGGREILQELSRFEGQDRLPEEP
ncbi:MAG: hydroxymethylbilane synthase [Planctomycetes bacterium]|nr:hydroxymethylbilane synthase [Planctomycetota bacterium]